MNVVASRNFIRVVDDRQSQRDDNGGTITNNALVDVFVFFLVLILGWFIEVRRCRGIGCHWIILVIDFDALHRLPLGHGDQHFT